MEFFGAVIGMSMAWWAVVVTIASLLFPLFWVWMLIDSILRNDIDYPGGNANEKLVWVLLIALTQFVAVFYYLMVYRKLPRRAAVPQAPVAPPQAPAATQGPATT